jgi:hypothetical protein
MNIGLGQFQHVVCTASNKLQITVELPVITLDKPLRSGWHRVTLPNVENPWRELLMGIHFTEYMSARIDRWCKQNTQGKYRHVRYNTWDFQKVEDALLLSLTWG